MGISPDEFRQMEERLQRNSKTRKPALPADAMVAVRKPPPVAPLTDPSAILFVQPDGYEVKNIVFYGKPMGKPRMTRRDQFIKRPKVVRYWAFKDALRAAAGPLPPNADMAIVTAWIPMPESWSKKKKAAMNGKPHRTTPDWDNIAKAVCDALFDQDSGIWVGATVKYWCPEGEERLNIQMLYAKS